MRSHVLSCEEGHRWLETSVRAKVLRGIERVIFVIGSFSCFATRGLGGQGFKGLE